MNKAGMAIRCPTATSAGWAKLPGWRLIINTDGWPTIVPSAKASLFGGLWKLTANDEDTLDHYEDVAGGLYFKEEIAVTTHDRQHLNALVYIAANSAEGTWTEKGVITNILTGAEQFELPDDYQNYLKNHFNEGSL